MSVTKAMRYQIFTRDDRTCRYCGAKAPQAKITIDHVIPQALGGTDAADNLVTACADCNSGKSAVPPDAPMVSDVAADALRWTRAMALVVEQERLSAQEALAALDQFTTHWNKWTTGSKEQTVPRDNNWEASIKTFIEQGLTIEDLEELIKIAMNNQKVKSDATWRYFCGCAWKRIQQRVNAATEIVVREEAEPQSNDDDSLYWPAGLVWDLHAGDDVLNRKVTVAIVTRLLGGGERITLADAADRLFRLAYGRRPSVYAITLIKASLTSIRQSWDTAATPGYRMDDPLDGWLYDSDGVRTKSSGPDILRNLLNEFGASDEEIELLLPAQEVSDPEDDDDEIDLLPALRALNNQIILACYPITKIMGGTAEHVKDIFNRRLSIGPRPRLLLDEDGVIKNRCAAWSLPDWQVCSRPETKWSGALDLHPYIAERLSLPPASDFWSVAIRTGQVLKLPIAPNLNTLGALSVIATVIDGYLCAASKVSTQTGHALHRKNQSPAHNISDESFISALCQLGITSRKPEGMSDQERSDATALDIIWTVYAEYVRESAIVLISMISRPLPRYTESCCPYLHEDKDSFLPSPPAPALIQALDEYMNANPDTYKTEA